MLPPRILPVRRPVNRSDDARTGPTDEVSSGRPSTPRPARRLAAAARPALTGSPTTLLYEPSIRSTNREASPWIAVGPGLVERLTGGDVPCEIFLGQVSECTSVRSTPAASVRPAPETATPGRDLVRPAGEPAQHGRPRPPRRRGLPRIDARRPRPCRPPSTTSSGRGWRRSVGLSRAPAARRSASGGSPGAADSSTCAGRTSNR